MGAKERQPGPGYLLSYILLKKKKKKKQAPTAEEKKFQTRKHVPTHIPNNKMVPEKYCFDLPVYYSSKHTLYI